MIYNSIVKVVTEFNACKPIWRSGGQLLVWLTGLSVDIRFSELRLARRIWRRNFAAWYQATESWYFELVVVEYWFVGWLSLKYDIHVYHRHLISIILCLDYLYLIQRINHISCKEILSLLISFLQRQR